MNDKDIIKSEITQVSKDEDRKRHSIPRDAKCYVNSNGYHVIDSEFADPLGIMQLEYRSNAWLKVKAAVQREVGLVLTNLFIERFPDAKIKEFKWSHKCGCRCGCSPGYHVRLLDYHKGLSCHDCWANVFLNEDAIKRIRYVIALQTVQHRIELQAFEREGVRKAMKELVAS